jgi:hypothetical protein
LCLASCRTVSLPRPVLPKAALTPRKESLDDDHCDKPPVIMMTLPSRGLMSFAGSKLLPNMIL